MAETGSPEKWLKLHNLLNIKTTAHEVLIENLSGGDITIFLYNETQLLKEKSKIVVEQKDVILA